MRRAVLMSVATMSLLGANAMADNFTFSFTDPAVGTVTGEIFGLQDDGVYRPATEVLITSAPASFGSFDPIATDWDEQDGNSFQETGGVITDMSFAAIDTGVVNLFMLPGIGNSFFESVVVDMGVADVVQGMSGTVTFTPVPEPFAWFLLLTVLLAVAIVKKKPAFFADPVARMRG